MPNEPGADQPQGTEVTFELFIVDDNDERVVRLTRRFWIEPELYNLYLDQRIENLTDRPLEIQYAQLGQGDLQAEVGYMGDMRRLAVGYYIPKYEPSIYTHDFEESRGNLIERGLSHKLWPTDGSQEAGYRMVWVGLVNRYFSATLHARTESIDDQIVVPVQPIEEVFPTVQSYAFGGEDDGRLILMYFTPPVELLPGSENALDVNVTLYGGPMSNEVLERPAYAGLHLEKQIRYKTGCCLSFDWLSKFLYRLLDFFHIVLRDWALAIMGLVVIIRLLLHPITKRSQLNMMKFSRQMSKLQPEIEKLKKKHKDDSAKLNQEMMQLYRERGVNPAAMAGGCLPMFLQTPIWIGLWAMLYFVFELRHEGAFFGVFQAISGGEWYFLADLSTDDNFIMLPEAARFSIPLLGYMDSINLIPFMLVLVFYLQQKFMQPPTAGPMSDQQKQQQKMMKWMIMLFPIMLYNAPSGLTLYMIASTGSGILDSMIVRKHLKELEERGELDKPKEKKPPKPGGIRDRIQKAAEAKRKQLEEMQKQQAKQQQQVSGGKRRSKRK
jgi:YidC/Oxa1 family membrane protein insertase